MLFFGQVHGQAGFGHTEAEVSKNIRKQATKVHNFNAHIAKDPRVELVILPLFDGLTLISLIVFSTKSTFECLLAVSEQITFISENILLFV